MSGMFREFEDACKNLVTMAPDAAIAIFDGNQDPTQRPLTVTKEIGLDPLKTKHGTVTVRVTVEFRVE